MHRFLVLPVLLFLCCCAQKRSGVGTNGYADTLIAFMKDSVNPYFHNHRPKEAGRLLDSIQPLVEEVDKYPLTCTWLRFKSVQFLLLKQFDSSRYYIDRSMALAKEKDTSRKHVVGAMIQTADLLKDIEQYDSALHYARDAYNLARKIDTAGLPIICLRLSEIYQLTGDPESERKYLFEGFRLTDRAKLKTVFANNISRFYDEQGQMDSAIYFFKAMEADTNFSSPYFDAVRYANLGVMLTRQNKLEEGLQYQLKATEMSRELGELDAEHMFNLAATYSKLKRYRESDTYLDSALTFAREAADYETIRRSWDRRAKNFAAQQQYAAAYSALDSAFDSFFTEVDSSMALRARELETKYAVKAKDDEIAALAFANKANEKISRQRETIIIAMIIAALLVTALVVLLWRRRQLEQKLREAALQQRLLRSQMEPHFIFNILSVLQSFIRNGEREKSIKYLNKFARLIRISLENARESFVPLKDEIAALDSYLSLQSMRFEGSFAYEIDVYELYEEDDLLIPPMLLQPFVENAILHGLRQIEHQGQITVTIRRNPHMLHCVIEDNGNGLQPQQPNAEKQSLSTLITQERLTMLSKQTRRPATLQIIDKKNENSHGIRVELDIPFKRKK